MGEPELAERLISGERRALARAITLVESARPADRDNANFLLEAGRKTGRQALRIGLSGTPGVGKSTFIEAFGLMLTAQGLRVAVLAVDPSSSRSGGSILGDKTRMERLSRDPNAYIRPSPSQTELGGVARRTRDAAALCEAAGFDIVLIETVGVGQSETTVAEMSDVFLLLLAPAGGDELQGIKRGIMEIADMILINKADGDLKETARRTCADYAGALRMLRRRVQDPEDFPKAMMVSAETQSGLAQVWEELSNLVAWRKVNKHWQSNRSRQARHWFMHEVQQGLLQQLNAGAIQTLFDDLGVKVAAGKVSPNAAARQVLRQLKNQ